MANKVKSWGVELLRLTAPAAVLLLWSGAVVAQGLAPQTASTAIAGQYLSVAFGRHFPDVASSRVDGLLSKRANETATHVFLILADSLAGDDASVRAAKRAVTDVLADLKVHAPGFAFDFRDEDEMLSVAKLPREEAQAFLSDSMAVYVGSREEIESYVARAADGGLDLSPTLKLAERVADTKSLSLCFAGSFYKPGGLNEIGVTIVFAEQLPAELGPGRACFYSTFMGAFGLRGRLPNGSGSIFSDDAIGQPTEGDWLLWRLHEDPELHFGMTAAVARAAVLHILDLR